MQFDDRLATVLRMRADSAAGERTQLRQLLDLLGTASPRQSADAAYARLNQLRKRIPAEEQALILREAGLRLRNRALVEYLAAGDARTAASVMATARLPEREWETLIPRLPITARGFLRHRRDLPAGARRQLELLGVGDLVLSDGRAPPPEIPAREPAFADEALPASSAAEQLTEAPPQRVSPVLPEPPSPRPLAPAPRAPADEPIGELIERIAQFRSARRLPVLAPRLPLGDAVPVEVARIEAFDAVTDAQGRVIWASPTVAPWIVGMALTAARPGPLVQFAGSALVRLRQRQPLRAQLLALSGAPAIAGDWRIDAAPLFAPETGAFTGYRCRAMRTIPAPANAAAPDSHADKMRQILHELRTPVNAIQGFAEIIQQQLFAPVPHEYRAHAAAIAVDAARLLAGFEEIDRLAQLESDAVTLEHGETDFRAAVRETLARLDSVLSAREAGFALGVDGADFAVAIAPSEARALCWRLLASAAAALGPGERIALALTSDGATISLDLDLPSGMREPAAQNRTGTSTTGVLSAGMFGAPFAFRLAAAEARAAGGALVIGAEKLNLTMPVLTASGNDHSSVGDQAG